MLTVVEADSASRFCGTTRTVLQMGHLTLFPARESAALINLPHLHRICISGPREGNRGTCSLALFYLRELVRVNAPECR